MFGNFGCAAVLVWCCDELEIQGKFYELYELDAEIGHKELDWKITLSGVGKCRQVSLKD